MGLFMGLLYWATRGMGIATQAGIGVGGRVRETFRVACAYGVAAMVLCTLFTQLEAGRIARFFTQQPDVVAAAATFLRYLSWNFPAVCSRSAPRSCRRS